ncbi:MAG TPA: NAD-dependent epimerase/dehydratase family protein [Thermoanaerobaculaceae bacterium]|nr:NAD-dependent epimerase/dehydratase family protein [Thermoanaerobaculaceae bacterium]
MSDVGKRWRALPVEITSGELAEACPRIPLPLAVTGATGFIGSHLVDSLLAGGVQPRLLVRDPARLRERPRSSAVIVRGGLDDAPAIRELVAGCATVVHLAGLVRAESGERFDRVNRLGTRSVVEALRDAAPGARLVHVSSLAAAGPSPDPAGRAPEDEPGPVSAYGRSKLAGELEARAHPGPWVVLRPPAVYGPRDIDVLQFFKLAARGMVPLPSGERWVTVAFVGDVVRAILAAAGGVADRTTLHVGEAEPRTMAGLVAVLAAAGGVRARVVRVPPFLVRALGAGGDLLQRLGMRDVAMTSDKARELLARHWSSRTEPSLAALGLPGFVPMPDGAAATWAWYRDRGWVRPRVKMPPA